MSVTIEGNYALTLDNSRNLMAGCAAFRTLLGVATPAQAKALTWWSLADDQGSYEQSQLPRAIVEYDNGYRIKRKSTNHGTASSTVVVTIEVDFPEQYKDSLQDALKWFRSQVGKVADQAGANSWSGAEDMLNSPNTFLDVEEISVMAADRGFPEKHPEGREYLVAILTLDCIGTT